MNNYQKNEILKFNEDYEKVIKNQLEKISKLNAKKISSFKNKLLLIITFGLYNWNKKIDNQIIMLQHNVQFYEERIKKSDEILRKSYDANKHVNFDSSNQNKFELSNSTKWENQPSTSGYKSPSL